MRRSSLRRWCENAIGLHGADTLEGSWFFSARLEQYPLGNEARPACWLVTGGRGSGKTRLGAEWVDGLVHGQPPFADERRRYGLIALVGETLADVREVMIEGPSGILAVSRAERPRFAVGVVCGLVFGGTAGVKIAVELGVQRWLGTAETMLMGSAAASLCAWWALGAVIRVLKRK